MKKCISAFELNLRVAVLVCRAKFSKVIENAQNPVENWFQKKKQSFLWFALNYTRNPRKNWRFGIEPSNKKETSC